MGTINIKDDSLNTRIIQFDGKLKPRFALLTKLPVAKQYRIYISTKANLIRSQLASACSCDANTTSHAIKATSMHQSKR